MLQFTWICIILIAIIIIRFIYIVRNKYVDMVDANIDENYKQVGSSGCDKKIFEKYREGIQSKGHRTTALDLFRIGSLYDYSGGKGNIDPIKAANYYCKSLEKIKEKYKISVNKLDSAPTSLKLSANDLYIINKIKDRIQLNDLYATLGRIDQNTEELPMTQENAAVLNAGVQNILNQQAHEDNLQQIILRPTHGRRQREGNANDTADTASATNIDPNRNQHWTSDSQNVHDSNINQDVVRQYGIISNTVASSQWDPYEIAAYLSGPKFADKLLGHDLDNLPQATRMLRYIGANNPNISLLGVNEAEYVGKIFTYIMQENSENKRQVMIENFITNLKDMDPTDISAPPSPVCINGRITRILSSLATPGIDGQDGLGTLKSGQLLRNEILARVGHTREQILNAANKEVVDMYNADNGADIRTSELHTAIISKIDNDVLVDYSDAKGIDLQEIRKEIIDNL